MNDFNKYISLKNNVLAFSKGPLSQWWGAFEGQTGGFTHTSKRVMTFDKDGQPMGVKTIFNCSEQAMMYAKACLFHNPKLADKILKEKNPKIQKELGREVENFKQPEWDKEKFNLVVFYNTLKFCQNQELRDYLESTFPYILVEAAPWDKIWGCGTDFEDERTYDVKSWQGENLLGKALMTVRSYLMISKLKFVFP